MMNRLPIALCLFLLMACSRPSPPQPTPAEVLGVGSNVTPQYKLVSTERFDIGGTARLDVKVTVPRGLAREELERNVRHALLHFYESGSTKFGAISVLAYASARTNGPYDAAKGDFAPHGEWSAASTDVPLSSWQAKIEFDEHYFQERKEFAIGTHATLTASEFSETIGLSRRANRWFDEDILAELKPSLPVVVVGKEDFGAAGVRYEVETARGPKQKGWVHSSALKAE